MMQDGVRRYQTREKRKKKTTGKKADEAEMRKFRRHTVSMFKKYLYKI